MAVNTEFPCSLIIDIPFPTTRLANIALQALSVDKELSSSVRRSFAIRTATMNEENNGGNAADKTIVRTTYEATTNRMLRVSVNAFLDSVGLVVEVMEGLDVDVLEAAEAAEVTP